MVYSAFRKKVLTVVNCRFYTDEDQIDVNLVNFAEWRAGNTN